MDTRKSSNMVRLRKTGLPAPGGRDAAAGLGRLGFGECAFGLIPQDDDAKEPPEGFPQGFGGLLPAPRENNSPPCFPPLPQRMPLLLR